MSTLQTAIDVESLSVKLIKKEIFVISDDDEPIRPPKPAHVDLTLEDPIPVLEDPMEVTPIEEKRDQVILMETPADPPIRVPAGSPVEKPVTPPFVPPKEAPTWELGTILDDQRVIQIAEALYWIALDPEMRTLESSYKTQGNLKTNCWESGPLSFAVEDLSAGFVGFQASFHQSLAKDFMYALLYKQEHAAATIAGRLIFLAEYGNLVLRSEPFLDANNTQHCYFMETKEILTSTGFVWACLCHFVGSEKIASPLTLELLHTFWNKFKTEHMAIEMYVFRAIAVLCRTGDGLENGDPTLDSPITFDPQVIEKTACDFLKMENPWNNLPRFEKRFYKKCMTNFHVSMGEISQTDVEDITGQDWSQELENELKNSENTVLSDVEEPQPLEPAKSSKRKAISPQTAPKKKKKNDFPDLPMTIRRGSRRLNCGTTGKPVYPSKDRKTVFVGPYKSVKNIRELFGLLEVLDIEKTYGMRILKPLGYFKQDDKFYIQYPLLASTEPKTWQLKEITLKKGEKLKVYDAKSLGVERATDYFLANPDALDGKFVSLYMTFFWLFILHVGERSLDNVLVVNGQFWFIDLDARKENPFEDRVPPPRKDGTQKKAANDYAFVLCKGLPKPLKHAWMKAFENHCGDIVLGVDEVERALGIPEGEEIGNEDFEKAQTPIFVAADAFKVPREEIYKPFVQALNYWFTSHDE